MADENNDGQNQNAGNQGEGQGAGNAANAANIGQIAPNGQPPANIGGGNPPNPAPAGQPPTGQPAAAEIAYQDFKLPQDMPIDADGLKSFKTVASKLKLSQDGAQELIDMQINMAKKSVQAQQAAFAKLSKEQQEASEKLLGAEPEKSMQILKKAVNFAGGKELAEFFGKNPLLANNPILVKAFLKIGQAISEDGLPNGSGATVGDKSFAETLYPNMPSNNG